jgi:hypothetical protein
MPQDSTEITTTLSAPLAEDLARRAAARSAARRTTARPARRPKPAMPAQRSGTPGGRLAIAILAGLAIGLVTLLIHGFSDPMDRWAFSRPEAQLPSLQAKHTLY